MVCAAAQMEGEVAVSCLGTTASACDLMGLMGLCARKGDELRVSVTGPDEEVCAEALRDVFTFKTASPHVAARLVYCREAVS